MYNIQYYIKFSSAYSAVIYESLIQQRFMLQAWFKHMVWDTKIPVMRSLASNEERGLTKLHSMNNSYSILEGKGLWRMRGRAHTGSASSGGGRFQAK